MKVQLSREQSDGEEPENRQNLKIRNFGAYQFRSAPQQKLSLFIFNLISRRVCQIWLAQLSKRLISNKKGPVLPKFEHLCKLYLTTVPKVYVQFLFESDQQCVLVGNKKKETTGQVACDVDLGPSHTVTSRVKFCYSQYQSRKKKKAFEAGLVVRKKNWVEEKKNHLPENLTFYLQPP